jgi:hypothetical protein
MKSSISPLYRELRIFASGPLKGLLDELIRIEETHVQFWQEFFHSRITNLDLPRRLSCLS